MSELDNVLCVENAIPSYASINESGFYALNAIEENYSEMMVSIGLNELALKESGVEPVNEADSIIDKIIGFFKAAWKKIQDTFEKFLNAIKKRIDELNTKFKNKKVPEFKKTVDAIIKSGEKVKFNSITDWKNLDAYAGDVKSYSAMGAILGIDPDATATDDESAMEKLKGKIATAASADSGEIKDVKAAAEKFFTGGEKVKVDIAFVKSNADKLFVTVVDLAKSKSNVKSAYKEEKKVVDDAIKGIKKNKDAISKEKLSQYKYMIQASTAINNVALSSLGKQFREYAAITAKVNMAGFKAKFAKDGKKAVGESATFQSEVASLFDWDI